jgi:hypothetical protein
MNVRRTVYVVATLMVAGLIWQWSQREPSPRSLPAAPAVATKPTSAALAQPSRLAVLAGQISADAVSPIAKDLNSASGSIRHDLEILNEVFGAWQTNFPQDGNPVGENDEITVALAGDNRLRFAFISPVHPAINARGEVCDRWGTPFRFHALSGTQMEIRSAGPDRKFGTADDVEFAPWPKPF